MATRKIDLGRSNHEERVANAALSPGHLIEVLSTDKVQKHSTEGGYAELLFAEENALVGKSVDDAYAALDIVSIVNAFRGQRVGALLKPAVAYAVGDKLISAGDGTLKKLTGVTSGVTVKQVVAVVEVAKDLTATGAVAALGVVRVL